MGNAGRQYARLAGAGAGQHEDGAFQGFDGFGLLGVQPGEVIRPLATVASRHGARRDAAAGDGRPFGGCGRRLRLARHLARLFVEEGHIVETIAHGA
ncbi:hypothetical protein ACVMH6_007429 [Rhizobium leguminosarum]